MSAGVISRKKTASLEAEDQIEAYDPIEPWFPPAELSLDLMFFRRLFERLVAEARKSPDSPPAEDQDTALVGLMEVQRSMNRLQKLLRAEEMSDVRNYDVTGDHAIGWWEFCVMWKEEKLNAKLSPMERLHLAFEDPNSSRVGRFTSIMVLCTIMISAASFVLSTLPSLQNKPQCDTCEPMPFGVFQIVDTVCVALFTLEYLLRCVSSAFMRTELFNQTDLIERICSPEWVSWPTPLDRMLTFVFAWTNLIDLAAILPSYITWVLRATEDADATGGAHGGAHIRNAVAQLTRLMRVVRALRLGRHLEAVVIVVRSMSRSVRALWLLVLNFGLGVIIWGAVMFYMEQGEYDSSTGAFIRPQDGKRSPFSSIPETFWFVMVTATTTGYGDIVPVTNAGRALAALCMVYSLCVLALPIGVIGSNFDAVWEEFDNEKLKERQWKVKAERMAREIIECLDPLSSSRRLMVEVFHNPPMPGNNDIFIGQAEVTLELEPDECKPVAKKLRCQLIENRAKSNRCISGHLDLEYSWTPREPTRHAVEMEGTLRINVLRAHGLACIDWKDSGHPDACVQLTLWPTSPSVRDASIEPKVLRTHVIMDESNPVWNESFVVEVCWSQDGITAKRESRRLLMDGIVVPAKADDASSSTPSLAATVEGEAAGRVMRNVKQLSSDIQELQASLPELQRDVDRLRETKDAMIQLLGLRRPTSSPCGGTRGADRQGGPRHACTLDLVDDMADHGVRAPRRGGWLSSTGPGAAKTTRTDALDGGRHNLPNAVPDMTVMARTLH